MNDRSKQGRAQAEALVIGGIAVFAVLLMALPTQAVSGMPANATFTFPYAYGTPVVPSGVGAQGVQGLTVPYSDLGPTSPLYGTQGHIGPVNATEGIYLIASRSVYLNVTWKAGTIASSVNANGASVTLQNITNGTVYSQTTGASGTTSFLVPLGWYAIDASLTGYIDFYDRLDVKSNALVTYYLMPSANDSTVVGNGAPSSTTSTIGVSTMPAPDGLMAPQLTVWLLNASNSDRILARSVTGSNGTAIFSSLNTAYTYAVEFDGYEQNATGVRWGMSNITYASFTVASGWKDLAYWAIFNSYNVPGNNVDDMCGTSSTTGTITGAALNPTGNWYINQNTTLIGGITTISCYAYADEPYRVLTIENAVVYYNSTIPWSGFGTTGYHINLVNSTLISLSSAYTFDGQGYSSTVYCDHSRVIGSYIIRAPTKPSIFTTSQSNDVPGPTVRNSIFYGEQGGSGDATGNVSNTLLASTVNEEAPLHMWRDTVVNATGPTTGGFYIGQANENLTWCQFDNSTLRWGNPNFPSDNYGGAWIADNYFGPNSSHAGSSNVIGTFTHNLLRSSLPWNTTYASVRTDTIYFLLPNGNVTYNNFTYQTLPKEGIEFFLGGNIQDNYFDAYMSPSTYANATLHSLAGTVFTALIVSANSTFRNNQLTYSAVYTQATGFDIRQNRFDNVGPQTISSTTAPGFLKGAVDNNTYATEYLNWTPLAQSGTNAVQGGETLYYNFATDHYVNFTHNTVYARGLGGGAGGIPAQGGPSGYPVNVTWNLFANNISSGPNPWYAFPFACDVNPYPDESYTTNVSDNWFLNLDNATVPVCSISGTVGSATGLSKVVGSGNHYYFRPRLPGGAPLTVNWPTTPFPTAISGGFSTPDNATYADFFESGVNVQLGIDHSLVFNTTRHQSGTVPADIWGIAPDVNVSTGQPIVSYSNGLVAGPQPNFFWHGYNYSEQVEPTQIEIGVNSSLAPQVSLLLTDSWVSPYKSYTVTAYNGANGQVVSTQNVMPNSTGVVTQGYYPSWMPLDTVFVLSNSTGGSTPPAVCITNCSGTPGNGILPPQFSPVHTYIGWVLIGALIIAVSGGVVLARSGKGQSSRQMAGALLLTLGFIVGVIGWLAH